ncbi:MAG: sodium:solute symporter family protein [Proteobacteria bacterium]|nr:sodium:solute symporter family protein [Pseudomonadota bacterium]
MKVFETEIDLVSALSRLDWIIIFLTFGATWLAALYGARRHRDLPSEGKNAIVMGRRLTLPLFVATLVATWYGGIFGVTEIAFTQGIFNFVTQGLFWYLAYVVFAIYLAPKLRSSGASTLPELVEQRFGPKAQKLASYVNVVNVFPVAYVLSLGILVRMITGLDMPIAMLLGIVFILAYNAVGGFAAVVYSDFIQAIIMCISVGLVIFFSVTEVGGFTHLKESLPPHFFTINGGDSWSMTFVWGFIAFATLVDPTFYQRCFAATDIKVARNGILISTVIWCVFDLCTTFGGMYAASVIPQAAPREAYMIYALQVLPDGFRGFFVGGIFATILSTIDSFSYVAVNTLSHDMKFSRFFKLKHKWARQFLFSLLVLLASYFIAQYYDGSFKKIWKSMGSFAAGSLLVPIVGVMLFNRPVSEKRFVAAGIASILAILGFRTLQAQLGLFKDIDSLYVAMLVSLIGCYLLPEAIFRKRIST